MGYVHPDTSPRDQACTGSCYPSCKGRHDSWYRNMHLDGKQLQYRRKAENGRALGG